MKRNLAKLLPVFVVLVLLVAGWMHRYWLFDSYRLLSFQPSDQITELADRAGLSEHGRRLFYAARPELLLEESFDQQCEFADLGLVLGCYRGADIFILDVTEAQLEPVEPVTAAHEMLHVVYARLNGDEESELESLLEAQLEQVTNQRILSEIKGYRNDPAADLYNEMHSIFGTELDDLIPELEAHYAEFFEDRSLVLAESAAYEKVFNELEAEIASYDQQLDELGRRIDNLETSIVALSGQISAERIRLGQLLQNNQTAQYNASVSGFNALVVDHNSKVELVQALVDEFNSIVAERNANVAAKNDLIKSLDSNVQTIE